jgi:hypothetical protein
MTISITDPFLKLAAEVNEARVLAGRVKVLEDGHRKGEFRWQHNGLRHSFISYRVAMVKNVAQVALEAGNSPQMIFSNYRELVTPQDAKAWFAITPKSLAAMRRKVLAGRPALSGGHNADGHKRQVKIVQFPAEEAA